MIDRYTHILQKKVAISVMAAELKKEFIGLDDIIDEVLTLITPWYFFPEGQLRPTIINICLSPIYQVTYWFLIHSFLL